MQKFLKAYAACFSKPTKIEIFFQDREQGSFNSVLSFWVFLCHVCFFSHEFCRAKNKSLGHADIFWDVL